VSRKGIILSGGKGTRLYPATLAISKQLLPVYDKPMIYYPLSTLMHTGIREVLIITTKLDVDRFKILFGNGNHLGIEIHYKIQEQPNGIAEAFILAEDFLQQDPSVLILGDNIFYGNNLPARLSKISTSDNKATILACTVNDPSQYGVINFNKNREILSIVEKPNRPTSKYAITGLYFYDQNVIEIAKSLKPSKRGELEITDLNQVYLDENQLSVQIMGREDTWLDAGSNDSFSEASQFIHTIEKRQGLKIACIEEIAWKKGWIDDQKLEKLAKKLSNSEYGKYLYDILNMKDKNEIL
jgi:glucose-1-phosphate thymidylyltransferase